MHSFTWAFSAYLLSIFYMPGETALIMRKREATNTVTYCNFTDGDDVIQGNGGKW